MNTYEQVLTPDAWVEVLGGKTTLAIDLMAQGAIAMTFTESADVPPIDAPFVRVESFAHGGDYYGSGLKYGQHIWVRALSGVMKIVVAR